MNSQIQIEELQLMIGRITMNYEFQLMDMRKQMQKMAEELQKGTANSNEKKGPTSVKE